MDWGLYKWVNSLQTHTAWAHAALRNYAQMGVALFGLAILVGWWLARLRRRVEPMAAVVWAPIAVAGSLGVNQALGHLVDRARPYVTHPGVHLLVARTHDFSFPSDHAAAAAAVAAALWFVDRRLGMSTAALALVMAFARVYVGAHYPGDAGAGLVIGAVVATGLWPVCRRATMPVLARLRTVWLGRLLLG